jgi:hypothetical protein
MIFLQLLSDLLLPGLDCPDLPLKPVDLPLILLEGGGLLALEGGPVPLLHDFHGLELLLGLEQLASDVRHFLVEQGGLIRLMGLMGGGWACGAGF